MARARDELDAKTFEVIEGVIERLDLKLAPIARARINVTDTESAAQYLPDSLLKIL
jgi:hypothetical protein